MKKFFKVLIVTILILALIGIILAVGVGAFVYLRFFKAEETAFEFRNSAEQITTIEIVDVTLTDEDWEIEVVTGVDDNAAFLADFKAMKCYTGIPMETVDKYNAENEGKENPEMEAIKINYTDGSYDLITAMMNVDSDYDANEILMGNFFSFDVAEFEALIDKYSAK